MKIPQSYINLITICITPLIRLIPRKRNKWLFGTHQNFKDNPKFLFYWTNEHHPEIRSIWIAHLKNDVERLEKQGFEVYYWLSLKGLYHALTAKVYISDHQIGDVNDFFSGGVFYVNLWHGSSVKRVRWQAPQLFVKRFNLKSAAEMRTSLKFRICQYTVMFRKPDLCLAPSTIQKNDFFAPMMDIPSDRCVVGVYPRSRLLLEGKEAALRFIHKYESQETADFVTELSKYNKVYMYMPTWRNDGNDFIAQAGIDWECLNNNMKEKNELFILKFHPFTKIDLPKIEQFSNIIIYPKSSDIYTVLPFIDVLVTDYSSIYTDFLTMDKEIILFVFDYDSYVKHCYELSEFDKYFVAKKAFNFEELLTIMKNGQDCHVPKVERERLLEFFWDSNKKRIDIVEEIKKHLK